MKNNRGQALPVILGIMVIFALIVPTMVYMVQHESKWTVRQKKTTAAFHAAETGIDRALWKLRESSVMWSNVVNGIPIPGYTGTTVYDLYANGSEPAGQYKVLISSTADMSKVRVFCVGRDPGSNQVRAIETILTRLTIDSSLSVEGAIAYKPQLVVHWGPVVSYTSISAPSSTQFEEWPQKISKGGISFRDTDPTPPNSDNIEYWAFQDLGNPPEVDLAYYRDLAKKSVTPSGNGYITGSATISYNFTSSTSVIYATGDLTLSNNSFLNVAAVIAEGNVVFKAKNGTYTATVPASAPQQYQKVPTYNYPGKGQPTYAISNCGMHGFLYCGGNFSSAGGNAVMCGVTFIQGTMSFNTFTVYYDPLVASKIKLSAAPIRQVSWKEVGATW